MPEDDYTIGQAIEHLREVLDTVPGYGWDGAYDLAVMDVGYALLRALGLKIVEGRQSAYDNGLYHVLEASS